jgi:hypothetical protein
MFDQQTTIGTCSLCAGPVQVPSVWMAVIPPTPTCAKCGARAAQRHGPVIPMERPSPRTGLTKCSITELTDGSRLVIPQDGPTTCVPLTDWSEPALDAWRRYL